MSTNAHTEDYRGCKITLQYETHPESPREWDNVGTMVCWHRRYRLGDEQPKADASDWVLEHVRGGSRWQSELDTRMAEARANNPGLDESELDDLLDAIEPAMEDDPNLPIRLFDKDNVVLPLYLYDHSDITMSTGPFSCPWDSGRVGFIYCSLAKAQSEQPSADPKEGWGAMIEGRKADGTAERITLLDWAKARLKGEVETYDAFLQGQIVGYIASAPNGDKIDSCWGFYPDEKGNWPDAIEQAKDAINSWHEDRLEIETATVACYI